MTTFFSSNMYYQSTLNITEHRPHLQRGGGLILEDGPDRLSRNVGTELPLYDE